MSSSGNVTNYSDSSTVQFWGTLLYLGIFIVRYFMCLLHYILEVNITFYLHLHLRLK